MSKTPIQFTKMHGLGNDFMVIDAISQPITFSPTDIRAMADRHRGIGFDQCLILEKSMEPTSDFFYRIFNADGSEVGQCGNGARAIARFAQRQGLTNKTTLILSTQTTQLRATINTDDTVTVDLGTPRFDPVDIPLNVPKRQDVYELFTQDSQALAVHALSLGNPHAVRIVTDLILTPVALTGRCISEHVLFPERCNAGFMQIISPNAINLRVYERGAGETQACGSGAAAAAVVARAFYHLESTMQVHLPGGDLTVTWDGFGSPVFLKGPAEFVYTGVYMPCALLS